MATLVSTVGSGVERSTSHLSAIADRIGTALKRMAGARYAEQCERLSRSGYGGMI